MHLAPSLLPCSECSKVGHECRAGIHVFGDLNWLKGVGSPVFSFSQLQHSERSDMFTVLVHAGLFCCFRNPVDSYVDYWIFNAL